MIKIEIKNRWTGSIIFSYEKENNTMSETIKEYIHQECVVNNKYRANLTRANLTDADLTDANLTRADLTDANLTRANLTRADLTDADLTRADLLRFKSDLWRVLLIAKKEIPHLKKSLIEGKVNGSKYDGECACLKGTLENSAKERQCTIYKDNQLVQSVFEPSEQWFLQIREGQTPETSNVVKLTLEWIEEFEMWLVS